jgi:hypothetical protein
MTARRHARCVATALIAALGLAGAAACGKKPVPSGPPPELTGLAVVPASAEVVVGIDLKKLDDAPVIERAADQLLARDPVLAERWQRLRDECKIDLGKQVRRILLALGPPRTTPSPGTGPVLMVAVGSLAEADLKDCVTKLVGAGGGTLTGTAVGGRTLYLAKDGNRTMYFAYSRPDTIVLGSDEAYLTEALGSGKKAPDNPDLTAWGQLVNQSSPIWAIGRTDPRVRDGLVQLTDHKVSAGPVAFAASGDFLDGAKLQLSAVMATAEQAKSLESYVKGELALLTAAAQLKSLGAVVGKLEVAAENTVVRFRVALTVSDVNQLLSALDAGSMPAQDRAPAPSPGSGAK